LNPQVGIVVPTLGTRPDFLERCLKSIRLAGSCHINLVAPASFDSKPLLDAGLADQATLDPSKGLSEAINAGIAELPEHVTIINWLGDDDLLKAGTLDLVQSEFSDPTVVLVYGNCDYVDESDEVIWSSPTGQFAARILRYGPDLIPQPGALFRRESFERVGGLSSNFGWAFDFDLLIKLSKLGKLKFVATTLSCFRWHSDSLTVKARWKSVGEASQVRKAHLPMPLKPISFLWETPVMVATYLAGLRVNKLASKAKKNG
jgi:GT2 family glycosyltransferase